MRTIQKKILRHGALGAASLVAAMGCGLSAAGNEGPLESQQAEQGYSLGHVVGQQMVSDFGDIDRKAFLQGFTDAVSDNAAVLTTEQMMQALAEFETERVAEQEAAAAALAEQNTLAGDSFRDQFAQQPGVQKLANGLLYQVIEAGAGEPPAEGATVTLHYRGSLVDGTEFDDSYSRGEPLTVPIDRVMPGWSAALERMPVGAKWKVVIPPSLAYGEQGVGGFIEPNTTLVFELERLANG